MANHPCLNVTSDDHKYSSPIPLIGLYTAAATLVCFLFMSFDVFHALHRKKPWIPCRFFSLNSLTLTLLGIAAKLPVDLTTAMPSAHDQLSKLSGSVLICISMGFFLPSLGAQSHYERLSNMASLTIFVVAVVVNVSIQMVTKVIFAFMVEHVIILSCIVLSLIALWDSTFRLHLTCDICLDHIKERLEKGDPRSSANNCLIYRMKLFYVSSYGNNPQLALNGTLPGMTMCMIPTPCTVVFSQAAIKSLALNNKIEFGSGVSDYKWSIWMVLVTQIFSIAVGCMATGFRWLTVVSNLDLEEDDNESAPDEPYMHIASWFKALRMSRNVKFGIVVSVSETIIVTLLPAILTFLAAYVMGVTKKCLANKPRNGDTADFMREEEFYFYVTGLIRWIQRKGEEDMKRLVEIYQIDSPTRIFQLFCKTTPSQESLINKFQVSSENRISCLSIVILVRMAIVSLPDTLSASLIHTLDEVFEIIYFIDKKMNVVNLRNKVKWMTAKYMWEHKGCIKLSVKKRCSELLMRSMDGGFHSHSQSQLDLNDALGIIEEIPLEHDMINMVVCHDAHAINEFIMKCQPCTSINELYNHIEQLFVDMLHFFFSQLPHAIVKDIAESPNDECEERARRSMKFLCKLAPLEDKVHWSFPIGTGITSLISPQVLARDAHDHIGPSESNASTHLALQVVEDGEIQEHA